MARITVEDCIETVPNRFDLVLLAGQRARALSAGAEPTVPLDRDKRTVIALREIAAGTVAPAALYDSLLKRQQRRGLLEDEADEAPGDGFGAFGAMPEPSQDEAAVMTAGGAFDRHAA